MHKYLRAIGFTEFKNRQEVNELLAYVIRVCEGELTKSEINGSGERLINQQMSYCGGCPVLTF